MKRVQKSLRPVELRSRNLIWTIFIAVLQFQNTLHERFVITFLNIFGEHEKSLLCKVWRSFCVCVNVWRTLITASTQISTSLVTYLLYRYFLVVGFLYADPTWISTTRLPIISTANQKIWRVRKAREIIYTWVLRSNVLNIPPPNKRLVRLLIYIKKIFLFIWIRSPRQSQL